MELLSTGPHHKMLMVTSLYLPTLPMVLSTTNSMITTIGLSYKIIVSLFTRIKNYLQLIAANSQWLVLCQILLFIIHFSS